MILCTVLRISGERHPWVDILRALSSSNSELNAKVALNFDAAIGNSVRFTGD